MIVSVVMPVHDGSRYVADAIASVQRQHGVALDVLVHDDGSTDGTDTVLRRLAETDPRIDVSTGPNRGPAHSRNILLARARGDCIAFLDHDDLWPEGRLVRQLRLLAATPGAPGVLGMTQRFESLSRDGRPDPGAGGQRVLTGLLQAALFRRAAVDAAGPFDDRLRTGDDVDFLLRLIEMGGPLVVDDELAAWYRIHPGQRTSDRALSGAGTAAALARSLQRRRATPDARADALDWRQPR